MENGKWQDNYVLRVEYPLALKYKKPIIPIMVEDVDTRILFDSFENIGDVIRCGKKYELQQKIKQISSGVFNKQEDLYSQYLIGMAFLNGVTTEVDVKKGIKIIRRAAENGQKNAIVKLAQMYYEGDRIAKNRQYAARYYKKLICEVEKSGSINDYPYCYANYAISIIDDTFGIRNYKESIDIMEHGINILRENENTDKEYLFYYALTLANYQKLIFTALYDEALEDSVIWYHKQDEAYNETMSILDELLLTDEYEEKYRRLNLNNSPIIR